jgi:hypothetical protein
MLRSILTPLAIVMSSSALAQNSISISPSTMTALKEELYVQQNVHLTANKWRAAGHHADVDLTVTNSMDVAASNIKVQCNFLTGAAPPNNEYGEDGIISGLVHAGEVKRFNGIELKLRFDPIRARLEKCVALKAELGLPPTK